MNRLFVIVSGLVVLEATAWTQVTQRVSVHPAGGQVNNDSYSPSISADGRYVAFRSFAAVVTVDTNGVLDVYVRDRQAGTSERVSVDSAGVQANDASSEPAISADGRYVAFWSLATNLVPGDTNGEQDVFVRDRQMGTTERVSLDSAGMQVESFSRDPSISADGRYVAFTSNSSTLVPGDTNGQMDVFVRDRQLGVTERVSVDSAGIEGDYFSHSPSISADGRCVAFWSPATNLVAGHTGLVGDIFVRDRQAGTTECVSVVPGGAQADSFSSNPFISADGLHVVFESMASNLVAGDANAHEDVFVHDRQAGTTELMSISIGGASGDSDSDNAAVSVDGRCVAFRSFASNLVPGDNNGSGDVFLRDRLLGTLEHVSLDWAGALGGNGSNEPSVSSDGRYVAFHSAASDLVPADSNGKSDIFVRDRFGGISFTSLCLPGAGGVMSCPCSNPSGGFGQGCDNSSATGGALLAAVGGAYLSSDTLVFITLGEKPTATSIVLQGNVLIPNGAAFGQGVRCAGGALKRLYTKAASGGSITAPDFSSGDAQVSARSAALGNPILAGQSRWYLVYYRDPIVLGGCPGVATFNATQTGEVAWSP